jgi:uncharacterized protein
VPPPRLLPELPLPPYAHVPGKTPHPESDPAGHSFGHPRPKAAPVDPARWLESREYLRGLDLFNHGYYWEAHEQWEALWHAAGRQGPLADFLKGLIRLAAAGVKAREGRPAGVASHARAAARLLTAASALGPDLCGLPLPELIARAEQAATSPPCPAEGKPVVFAFTLVPAEAPP